MTLRGTVLPDKSHKMEDIYGKLTARSGKRTCSAPIKQLLMGTELI
ncbi:MAG: hypothetical protein ABF868_07415 [Sporolactobacillus sp.]